MYALVVDDERISRIKLTTIMRKLGKAEMAETGSQAIEMFETAYNSGIPFDVVTLDIEMPDLLGTEVLRQYRDIECKRGVKKEKGVVVIMVTAQMDRINVYTAIALGCDDYIIKPFNMEIIKRKLKRFDLIEGEREGQTSHIESDTIFKNIQKALKNGDLDLPVLPQISIKFREMFQQNAAIDELAILLKQDVMITTKLIQIANSSINRGFEKVDTVGQAISRLGLSVTERIVVAVATQQLFISDQKKYKKMLNYLWNHCLATAYAANSVCQLMDHSSVIDVFTAGLLHDIGSIALIHIIAEMEKKGGFFQEINSASIQETAIAHHIKFGTKFLKKLNFNDTYIDTIQYHETFNDSPFLSYEILVIHFSNTIARSLGYTSFGQEETIDFDNSPSAKRLQLNLAQIHRIQEETQSIMETSDLLLY